MKTVFTITSDDIKAVRYQRRITGKEQVYVKAESPKIIEYFESKIPILKKGASKRQLKKNGKRIFKIKLLNEKEVNESWTRVLNKNTSKR